MCAGDPQSPRTFGEKAGAKSEARLLSREATAAVGLGEAAAKIATVRPLDGAIYLSYVTIDGYHGRSRAYDVRVEE
jgi:hypothetical protein